MTCASMLRTARRRARRVRTLGRDDARALLWTQRVFGEVRRELRAHGTNASVPAPPAGLSLWSGHQVSRYLRWRRATCLERSLILQRWLAAHGKLVPVVIGVGTTDDVFAAHAWLPGFDPETEYVGYREISRIEPVCV